MNLRRCLASFFTFARELKFTNNEKKFLEINLILYFSFYSYLLYFRNKKLFLRHVNQILYSPFKNTVQKNFMSVKNRRFSVSNQLNSDIFIAVKIRILMLTSARKKFWKKIFMVESNENLSV